MKKILSVTFALLMILGGMSVTAFAIEESATVYVSVANKGTLVATQVKTKVTDIDGDGVLTVNDALYALHENVYAGGANAGYGYYTHKDYGLSLSKLWGDTSGNFGYFLNNNSCWSLADKVKSGDYLNAFIYSDGKFYSDSYTFFDSYTVSASSGSEISLVLTATGYDESYNTITFPLSGAEITVDGASTGVKTDENGKAVIKIEDSGSHVISAVTSSKVIVPPVCTAKINGGIFDSIISAITSFVQAIVNFFLLIFA